MLRFPGFAVILVVALLTASVQAHHVAGEPSSDHAFTGKTSDEVALLRNKRDKKLDESPLEARDETWRTETCLLRGCQPLVASLIRDIARAYEFYETGERYSVIAELPSPEVHFISRTALAAMACPDHSCDPIGWFPNKGNVVYLASDQDVVEDYYSRGILVHELVHYVQHKLGDPVGANQCLTWKAREMQAYGIQYHWLRVNRQRIVTPPYNLRLAGYARMRCEGEGEG